MLSFAEVLALHDAAIKEFGGSPGILTEDRILSALNQPLQTFGGVDLYEGPIAKSAALGFFLTKAHGFQDGNKRVGYMAMKVALLKSGYHLKCTPDDGEFIILAVAEGEADLNELTRWAESHVEPVAEIVASPNEEESPPLSFAENTPISDKARIILETRPPLWKEKMHVQVLNDEIAKCDKERAEHKQGFSSAPKVTFSQSEFFAWWNSVMQQRGKVIEIQERIIDFLSTESFSEPDGNLDYMISLSRELGGIYRDVIVWSQQFRQVDMPEAYHPLLRAIASYFDSFINSIEQIPATIHAAIEKIEASPTEETHHIHIAINWAPEEEGRVEREVKSLTHKLGITDENGVSAREHIHSALHALRDIMDIQLAAIQRYMRDYSNWGKQLSVLGNRPASIATPQTEAVKASLAQRTRTLSRCIESTHPTLENVVEKLEQHNALMGMFIDPTSPESLQGGQDDIEELTHLTDFFNETLINMPHLREIMHEMHDLSPNIASAADEMSRTLDVQGILFRRFSDSCARQIDAIRAKIPVV
jgi:death-on-curing protein